MCQWFVGGRLFSPGPLVSYINKTDHHNILEILLNRVLNTITLTRCLYILLQTENHSWLPSYCLIYMPYSAVYNAYMITDCVRILKIDIEIVGMAWWPQNVFLQE